MPIEICWNKRILFYIFYLKTLCTGRINHWCMGSFMYGSFQGPLLQKDVSTFYLVSSKFAEGRLYTSMLLLNICMKMLFSKDNVNFAVCCCHLLQFSDQTELENGSAIQTFWQKGSYWRTLHFQRNYFIF